MDILKQHLSPEELALAAEYLHKKQALPTEIQNHIDSCASCKYELISVLELSDFEAAQPEIVFWQSRKWLTGIAAVAIILLAIGIYWFLVPQPNLPEKQFTQVIEKEIDSVKIIKDSTAEIINKIAVEKPEKVVLAQADFMPNLELENLVARYQTQLRSAEISPVVVEKSADGFRFRWEADGILVFEIFDNKGVLLQSWETDKQFAVYQTKNPGLYYFKLINEDFDLLWCGSFELR
ncbi:MAG: hypothetical protein M0Q90_10810 [Bacteroidales bacterium]|nr:hypothetical protein [Bacteroidales bacterium]